ncbi:hypothetical protein C8Q73DRAFT_615458, partial [Cubamyces lactineus]
ILAKLVNRTMDTVSVYMIIITPFCAELGLVPRVIAAYPSRFTYWPAQVCVYGLIVAFKTARIVNIVIFIMRRVPLDGQAQGPFQLGKIEWFLQSHNMTLTSALFLMPILRRLNRHAGFVLSTFKAIVSRQAGEALQIEARIRTLFWIAASKLIFPVLLNVIQLCYTFRDENFFPGAYVYFVNVHVQIILGALLAIIRCAGTQ